MYIINIYTQKLVQVYKIITYPLKSVSWYPYKRSKDCNMLSIRNKLTLQKNYNSLWQKCVFREKGKNTSRTKQKIKHKNPCPKPGIEPGNLRIQQLKIPIVVKLFNWFNAKGRKVNKQSRMCGHHFQQNHFSDYHIWQFFIFTVANCIKLG